MNSHDRCDPSQRFSRRKFIAKSTLATAAALGVYAFGIEPQWISVERNTLPTPNLPKHLIGKTAVQLSDLHIGDSVSDDYLLRQFEYVDSLQPDFVFFTGDYLDDASAWHVEKGRQLMKRFPRGKLGTACVLGNHDFGDRSSHLHDKAENTQRLVDHFGDEGLNLLIDSTIELNGLHVAGLRDLWHGGFDNDSAQQAISEVKSQPAIVLSHNPDTADLPIWDGYDGWILSGHTHGGQCKFPFIGAPVLPVINKRYVAGRYDVPGGHKLYINRGIGHTTHRVRFMARPEISVFTLARA